MTSVYLFLAFFLTKMQIAITASNDDVSPDCKGILVNAVCPVFCVVDLSMCSATSRNCSVPGLYLCPDGRCRPGQNFGDACVYVSNVCSCHESAPLACARTIVSVPKSVSEDKDAVDAFCLQHYNTSSPFGICSSSSKHNAEIKRVFEAIYYTLIGLGSYAFLFCGWVFWRSALATGNENKSQAGGIVPENNTSIIFNKRSRSSSIITKLRPQYGYQDSLLGNAIFLVGVAGTFVVLGICVTICSYYYVFIDLDSRFIEEIPFRDLNVSFIIIWHILFAWFFFLKVVGARLMNLFRIPTAMRDATTVDIWTDIDRLDIVEGNVIVRFVHKIRTSVRERVDNFLGPGQYVSVPVRVTPAGRRYIEFNSERLTLNNISGRWEPVILDTNEIHISYAELCENGMNGLSSDVAAERLDIEGPNSISIQAKSDYQIVFSEFSRYPYLYQCSCLAVNCYMSYWIIALIHFSIIIITGVIRVVMERNTLRRIQKSLRRWKTTKLNVIRDGRLFPVNADEIVIGDIVSLDDVKCVPFDGVIVSGTVVADESSLSGDPTTKTKRCFASSTSSNTIYQKATSGSVHTIFAGSTILFQERDSGRSQCLAVVVDKGANTVQGKHIKASLYPKQIAQTFEYELEVAYCILVAWSALAFFVTLTSVVIIKATLDAWFYGVLTLANVIIPLLPTFLNFGQILSSRTLRGNGVLANLPQRILTAGKVKVFAFDKTGTLTNSTFLFAGVVPVINGLFVSTDSRTGGLQIEALTQTMACAHSLSLLDSGEISGPDIDLEMFRSTGWTLAKSVNSLTIKSLGEDKIFDVLHQIGPNEHRNHMCSVTRNRQTGIVYVFLKGSPESILSVASRQSVPSNYKQTCMQHAQRGSYTLALAYRVLGQMSDAEIRNMKFQDLEADCIVAGVLLFQNDLRPEAVSVMKSLREADVRPIILTGDNLFTACHVAEQLGLMQEDDTVIFADLNDAGYVSWTDLRTSRNVSSSHVLRCIEGNSRPKCELAASGPAFRILAATGALDRFLFHFRVFARLSAFDKKNIIHSLQKKVVVGMCGDGANDCEALQIAHVGLSLCDGENRIPSIFETIAPTISSSVDLISIGRSALLTNQKLYRFSMIYGETLLWAGFIGYALNAVIPIVVWAFTDGPVLLSIATVIVLSHQNGVITERRPTARLLGPTTMILVIGTILINIVWLVSAIVLLYQLDFLQCGQFDGHGVATIQWWKIQDNAETAVISTVVMFQCIFSGVVMMINFNQKNRFYLSRAGIVIIACLLSFLVVMILSEPNRLSCMMRINCGTQDVMSDQYQPDSQDWNRFYSQTRLNVLPFAFRIQLIGFCMTNGICIVAFHIFTKIGPIRRAIKKKYRSGNQFQMWL